MAAIPAELERTQDRISGSPYDGSPWSMCFYFMESTALLLHDQYLYSVAVIKRYLYDNTIALIGK